MATAFSISAGKPDSRHHEPLRAFALWGSAEGSVDRIGAVLDTQSTMPDPSDPVPTIASDVNIEFD